MAADGSALADVIVEVLDGPPDLAHTERAAVTALLTSRSSAEASIAAWREAWRARYSTGSSSRTSRCSCG